MKALKIVQCSDSMMWYAEHVGKIVPLLRVYHDCFMSREPTGYANIVKKQDAIVIEVGDDSGTRQSTV